MKAVLLMVLLCVLWGGNMVAIKVSIREIPPLFAAGLRSLIAGCLVAILMVVRGMPLFTSKKAALHGLVVGILFGSEFACIYLGMKFTLATRTSILLYTHPFIVAIGAHLILTGDRLHINKVTGLLLAFCGIVVLFLKDWGAAGLETLTGDLLILLGAAGWALTTLYIKRYLTSSSTPLQVLLYQLVFSVPLLIIISLLTEKMPSVSSLSAPVLWSFTYQCVIIAFLSYVAWFELIHRYKVSILAAFTFFTPLFGVFLSWLLLPGEALRPSLLLSLVLVCAGMIMVNRPSQKPA